MIVFRYLTLNLCEANAVMVYKTWAEEMRGDMLQDIRRTSTDYQQMKFPDLAQDWGG